MSSIKSKLNGGAVLTMMQTVVKYQSWLIKSAGVKGVKLLMYHSSLGNGV